MTLAKATAWPCVRKPCHGERPSCPLTPRFASETPRRLRLRGSFSPYSYSSTFSEARVTSTVAIKTLSTSRRGPVANRARAHHSVDSRRAVRFADAGDLFRADWRRRRRVHRCRALHRSPDHRIRSSRQAVRNHDRRHGRRGPVGCDKALATLSSPLLEAAPSLRRMVLARNQMSADGAKRTSATRAPTSALGRQSPRRREGANVRFNISIAKSRHSAIGQLRSFGCGWRKVRLGSKAEMQTETASLAGPNCKDQNINVMIITSILRRGLECGAATFERRPIRAAASPATSEMSKASRDERAKQAAGRGDRQQ